MSKFSDLKLRYKVGVGVATAGTIVAVGSGAFAFWSNNTTGSGTAGTGSALSYSVTADSTPSGLAPGVSAASLGATVKNTSPHTEAVPASVTVTISSVTKAVGNTGGACTASDYTLSNPVMTTSDTGNLTSAGSDFTGASIAFNSTDQNQDGCQGATVNLTYTVNP